MSAKSLLPVVGTAVVGVVLWLWGFLFLQRREQRVLSADFRAMAGDQVSTIERKVLANFEVLESLRSDTPNCGATQSARLVWLELTPKLPFTGPLALVAGLPRPPRLRVCCPNNRDEILIWTRVMYGMTYA